MDTSSTDHTWAAAAVRKLLTHCMRVAAMQLEQQAAEVRLEMARRGAL